MQPNNPTLSSCEGMSSYGLLASRVTYRFIWRGEHSTLTALMISELPSTKLSQHNAPFLQLVGLGQYVGRLQEDFLS
jgi:hypothetical protein